MSECLEVSPNLKEDLISERKRLAKRYSELSYEIKRISDIFKGKGALKTSLEMGLNEKRSALVNEFEQIKARLSELRLIISETPQSEVQLNREAIFKKTVAELFTKDQLRIIGKESDRRASGLTPIPLPFKIADKKENEVDVYRELCQTFFEVLFTAREGLNEVIKDGCKKHGNADFLKLCSPVNKALIPLAELNKIKRLNHLK